MAHVEQSLMQDCEKPCSSSCNCRNTPECAGPIERKMQQHLATQLKLCHELEAIADGLPNNFDRQKLLVVARNILPTIKEAHQFEEYRIFPHIQVEAEEGSSNITGMTPSSSDLLPSMQQA